MRLKICRLCVAVSLLWLLLQVGIASNLLLSPRWLLFSGIAMGGSVVGIAYQRLSKLWKWTVVAIGLPLVYVFVTHIGVLVIGVEIIILIVLGTLLFVEREGSSESVKEIQDKLKNCC